MYFVIQACHSGLLSFHELIYFQLVWIRLYFPTSQQHPEREGVFMFLLQMGQDTQAIVQSDSLSLFKACDLNVTNNR